MCVDNEMGTKVPSPPRAPGMRATPCCLLEQARYSLIFALNTN